MALKNNSIGYSLLEVLIALLILNFGMSALFFGWSLNHNAKTKQKLRTQMQRELVAQVDLLRFHPQALVDSLWPFEIAKCIGEWQLDVMDTLKIESYGFEKNLSEEQLAIYLSRAQEAKLFPQFKIAEECPRPDTLYFSRSVP